MQASRDGHDRQYRQQQFGVFQQSLRNETRGGRERTESKGRSDGRKSIEGHQSKEKLQSRGNLLVSELSKATKPKYFFCAHDVKNLMDEILCSALTKENYDANSSRKLCLELADVIKGRVKGLGMVKYRFVCHVSIGSCAGQGLLMASRFIWNEQSDSFVTSTFRNASLFAVATVFGVLKE